MEPVGIVFALNTSFRYYTNSWYLPSEWLILTVYFNTYVIHLALCTLNKKTPQADQMGVVSVRAGFPNSNWGSRWLQLL